MEVGGLNDQSTEKLILKLTLNGRKNFLEESIVVNLKLAGQL